MAVLLQCLTLGTGNLEGAANSSGIISISILCNQDAPDKKVFNVDGILNSSTSYKQSAWNFLLPELLKHCVHIASEKSMFAFEATQQEMKAYHRCPNGLIRFKIALKCGIVLAGSRP